MATSRLPAFALFPISAWRDQLPPDEWVTCLNAWLALIDSHLSLSDSDFGATSVKDESLQAFLSSFTREVALGGVASLGSSPSARKLLKDCFRLATRLLQSSSPPSGLAQWEFLADLSHAYGKKKVQPLTESLSTVSKGHLDSSLAALKKFLIKNLDAGLDGGDLKGIEERLERVNDLILVSPPVAEFFLAGSDFVDALISCYRITNPPLRKALIATTYLCLTGLAERQKMSALTDHLYSLKAAADSHKASTLNVNDSLVAELVTSTPLLQRLERKLDETSTTSNRTKSVLTELATFKKPGGGMSKPKRLIRRKVDKGKGLAEFDEAQAQQEIHIHRMSQISQVQDLFPELGTGFVAKLLDEYDSNPEEVITHLLDDSLPPHLQTANRAEELAQPAAPTSKPRRSSLLPRPTPPLHPYPNHTNPDSEEEDSEDDFPLLPTSTTQIQMHIGKRPGNADTLLFAPQPAAATATRKSAILSALAAFDSDDDERDDTYDAADVGGTVDTTPALGTTGEDGAGGAGIMTDAAEGILFRAWLSGPGGAGVFARDAAARRGAERARVRLETGLTDEAVEGWAVMLGRDAGMKRRLMARYGEWSGEQTALGSTAWRAGADGGGDGEGGGDGDGEEGASDGSGARGRGGGGGGGFGPGGRGRGLGRFRGGRGGGAPPPAPDSEAARRRKEANKGSRANHDRRQQRAKKMARGGFAG